MVTVYKFRTIVENLNFLIILVKLSYKRNAYNILIELGFNDTSTIVGNFVLSPRERKKRNI